MTLASLPTLSVQIAFNPTNVQSLTQTWTDVTPYVRDFTTKLGRQHFLDRVEAGTLNMTVNERTGFFLNGSVNGTGYVIQPRLPIKVTATWSGTTYPVFYGLIDSVDEKITDQLNVDLSINATDLVKYLSLRYMSSNNFWNTYAKSASATNWFRCDLTAQATVTAAVSPSVVYSVGYTDYTAVNNFSVGQIVTVTGLTTLTGASTNTTGNATVVAASGSSFTLNATSGSGVGGGSGVATVINTYDQISTGGQGYYVGPTGFNPNGAMVYSPNGSIDLANGSTIPSGYLQISDVPSGTSGAVDFWILGQGIGGQQITTVLVGSPAARCQLRVAPTGQLEAVVAGSSAAAITSATSTTTVMTFNFAGSSLLTAGQLVQITGFTPAGYNGEWTVATKSASSFTVNSTNHPANATVMGYVYPISRSSVTVNDGYWHHVGFCNNTSGQLCVYVDGTLTPINNLGTYYNGWTTTPGLTTYALIIGAGNGNLGDSSGTASLTSLIDEVVISNNTNYATTLTTELLNRYKAGTLLTQGFPVTSTQVLSGDRIAEILCIAGFGTISGGQVVLNSNTYYINDSATAWVNGASGNGFIPVEPWYWDSPVTGSTALDLILQICDTDIGSFYQEPNGTFSFYNQNYYGTWSWNSTTSTGTWTPNNVYVPAPSGDHIWTDDTSSSYHYYGPTLQVMRDDVDTWTTVKVAPQSGTEQVYENAANEPRWGYSTLTKSGTLHTALTLALSTANFLGNLFKTPLPRISNVELRSETSNGGNLTALLNTEFGDIVTIKRTSPNASTSGTYPSQMGQISTNMVVESISHDFQSEPGFWHTSFILDPYPIRS